MLTRLSLVLVLLGLSACGAETVSTTSDPITAETDASPTPQTPDSGETASADVPDTESVLSEPLTGVTLATFESFVDRRLTEMGTSRDETNVRHVALDLSVPEPDWEVQGSLDVLVLYEGPSVCGTGGCTLDIASFSIDAEEFVEVGTVGLVRTPIRVAQTVTNNQRDLIVHVGGGGIEPFESLLQLDFNTDSIYPSEADGGERATQAQIDGAEVVLF